MKSLSRILHRIVRGNRYGKDREIALFTAFEERLANNDFFMPRIIHIETRSKCNGTCDFCAASVKHDTRTDELMDETLYDRVIGALAEIDYNNRLSLYNNNEPFLDKRLPEFLAEARHRLPNAYLELKTNGSILNVHKIHEVFNAGLDCLYINDYRDTEKVAAGEFSPNILKINDAINRSRRFKGHYDGNIYYRRIIITLRDSHEVRSTRAGTAPNRQVIRTLPKPCLRPFEMITISPRGVLGLCSEDVFYREPVGDLTRDGITDIWTSTQYTEIRRRLLHGDRGIKKTCSECDYRGYHTENLAEHSL